MFSCESYKTFKETFFVEHIRTTASELSIYQFHFFSKISERSLSKAFHFVIVSNSCQGFPNNFKGQGGFPPEEKERQEILLGDFFIGWWDPLSGTQDSGPQNI